MKILSFIVVWIFHFSLAMATDNTQDTLLNKNYLGGWPSTPKLSAVDTDMVFDCPGDIGCECVNNSDCININCIKLPKGKYCIPKVGDSFPSFIATDQYGDNVNIYDFSNQGKHILLEMGTTWCTPCHLMASWLSYNDQEISNKRFWNEDYQQIYNLIQNDSIYYITVLYENDFKGNVTYETLYEWFNLYPDEKIPILADSEKFLHRWIKPTGLPAVILLNEKMKIVTYSSRGMNAAFDSIIKIYNEK